MKYNTIKKNKKKVIDFSTWFFFFFIFFLKIEEKLFFFLDQYNLLWVICVIFCNITILVFQKKMHNYLIFKVNYTLQKRLLSNLKKNQVEQAKSLVSCCPTMIEGVPLQEAIILAQ